MATNESTASGDTQEPEPRRTKHAFKPFEYGHEAVEHAMLPGGAVQHFANEVEAVSMGAASILRLIDWDEQCGDAHQDNPEKEPAPVLNDFHRGVLLRLVAVNMDLLTMRANDLKNWAFEHHTAEGKGETLARAMHLVKCAQH